MNMQSDSIHCPTDFLGSTDLINVCRFAPEIFAGKEENRRNPGGFQDFLTQISGNLRRKDVCGD